VRVAIEVLGISIKTRDPSVKVVEAAASAMERLPTDKEVVSVPESILREEAVKDASKVAPVVSTAFIPNPVWFEV
jgi:Tfp pilus assembly PilM family ATPase